MDPISLIFNVKCTVLGNKPSRVISPFPTHGTKESDVRKKKKLCKTEMKYKNDLKWKDCEYSKFLQLFSHAGQLNYSRVLSPTIRTSWMARTNWHL